MNDADHPCEMSYGRVSRTAAVVAKSDSEKGNRKKTIEKTEL